VYYRVARVGGWGRHPAQTNPQIGEPFRRTSNIISGHLRKASNPNKPACRVDTTGLLYVNISEHRGIAESGKLVCDGAELNTELPHRNGAAPTTAEDW
jgi:hypothetical protein